MSLQAHVTELKRRHAHLARRVETEQSRPGSNDFEIAKLKREKLRLKEEIARLNPREA